MNTDIMIEWLCWFNLRIKTAGKKVLLLMDNYSAHKCAAKRMEETGELTHIQIEFLPDNTTSHHQPLDQGIIQNWKAHI